MSTTETAAETAGANVTAFSFGDPEPIMRNRDLHDYLECWSNGRWYETPISTAGLARALRVGSHHESAIRAKVNLLRRTFEPTQLLSRDVFGGLALDFLTFGNCYPELRRAVTGRAHHLERPLARFVRRGVDVGQYYQVHGFVGAYGQMGQEHTFEKGSVFQLLEPDVNQDLYGLPEYVSALQSAFLNESATIFRRRYYENGSHAGFILLATDATMDEPSREAIRGALKDAKGVGNFKNMFVHMPNGKPDSLKLIPIAEVAAKDEFLGIKNTSRDDVLAAHRVPPQLLGVVPKNTGGFGNVIDAAKTFYGLEIVPIMRRFEEVNDWLGMPAVAFKPMAENDMLQAVLSAGAATSSPAR